MSPPFLVCLLITILVVLHWTRSNVPVSLVLWSPELEAALRLCLTSARLAGRDHLSWPAPSHASQEAIGPLGCSDTLSRLTFNLLTTWTPGLFPESYFAASQPPACSAAGGYSPQWQDFALPPAALHEVLVSTSHKIELSLWVCGKLCV